VLKREGSYTYSFKGGTDLTFTYTLPLLSRRNILSIRCPPNALGNLPKCFLCRIKLKATCFTRKGAMDIKLEYPQHADHIAHPGTLLICCQTLIHLQPQFCYECKCTVSIKRDMHIPTDWLALKHGMSHRNWTWKHVWAVDDLSQVSFCKDEASQIQIHCKLWEKTRLHIGSCNKTCTTCNTSIKQRNREAQLKRVKSSEQWMVPEQSALIDAQVISYAVA